MLFNTLLKITPHNRQKRKRRRKERTKYGVLHDDIHGRLPIQFLNPPERASTEWRYQKTEYRQGYCEIRISSLCCDVVHELSSEIVHFMKFCSGVYRRQLRCWRRCGVDCTQGKCCYRGAQFIHDRNYNRIGLQPRVHIRSRLSVTFLLFLHTHN